MAHSAICLSLVAAVVQICGWQALALGPRVAPLVAPAPGPRLTGDVTLNQSLSLESRALTVGDLLARVGQATGVPLTCDASWRDLQVIVYAKPCAAGEPLERLAGLLEGQWEKAGGRSGGGYGLAPKLARPTPGDVEERLIAKAEAARKGECQAMRGSRAARLSEYGHALSLSRGELLGAHEQSDPWLCADVLDPAGRGLLQVLAHLSPLQVEALLSEGTVALPVVDLPMPLRRRLGDWARGRWGWPGGTTVPLNPDLLLRFDNPRDRWSNSVVILTWTGEALQLQLAVPDLYVFRTRIAHLRTAPESEARQKLTALGVTGVGAGPTGAAAAVIADQASAMATTRATGPPPDTADRPCSELARAVDLSSLAGRRVPVSEILAQVAAQTDLPVLAVRGASREGRIAVPKGPQLPASVGEAMALIGLLRGPSWSWQVAEGWLVLREEGLELLPWADAPEGLVRGWQARVRESQAIPLDDLATLSAALNPLQSNRFGEWVKGLRDVPLGDLRLYGSLSAQQREALLRGEVITVASLSAQHRREALRRARPTHPWFTEADLGPAVLRLVPQMLCTEEAGVTLVMEYRRPESPRDRDVVFVMPLELRLPEEPDGKR